MRSRARATVVFFASLAAAIALVARAPSAAAKDPKGKDAGKAKAPPPLPPPAPGPTPVASQVIVRAQPSLADALKLVLARAKLTPTAGVAIVLDATPTLKTAADAIKSALGTLSSVSERPMTWQVGPLGGSLSSAVADPAALGVAVDASFARGAASGPKAAPALPVGGTIGMLRGTLKKAAGPSGLVVYLADAHFEDDVDLEGFIGELRASKRSLSVIGPEAAFERPWGDVLADRYSSEHPDFAIPGVGRSPFGPEDPAAPWRGGDTAYPMMPYYFGTAISWDSKFRLRSTAEEKLHKALQVRSPDRERREMTRPPDPEKDTTAFARWASEWVVPPDRATEPEEFKTWLDSLGVAPDFDTEKEAFAEWRERFLRSAPAVDEKPEGEASLPDPSELRGLVDHLRDRAYAPLPSGFGPHGLMRATGMTGGAYVTWGWTKSDLAPTRYDFGRVNLFPPDLRARSEIFADILYRPWALALLHAWNAMTVEPSLVHHSPPWAAGAPVPIAHQWSPLLIGVYETPKERDESVKEAKTILAAIDKAKGGLEAEARAAGEPKDDVDRRLRADADLLVHALDTARFHVGEYVLWSDALAKAAWKVKRSKSPYVNTECFIRGTEDDKPVESEPVEVKDKAAGERLVSSRKAFLDRYRGTPFGAMVAKNYVWTYKLDVLDMTQKGPIEPTKSGKGASGAGTPATPPAPTGGSTGTPGPTTGK